MTDAEIAGYMDWRGPGAYTAHHMKRIKRIIEEVQRRDRESMLQLFTDPENQPTQYGTVTMEYMQREIVAVRESCAKLCDEIAIDMWNLYKGRPPYKGDEEGRASDFTQGRSAGADDCAEAIRSMK